MSMTTSIGQSGKEFKLLYNINSDSMCSLVKERKVQGEQENKAN